MNIKNNQFLSIEQIQNSFLKETDKTTYQENRQTISFQDILNQKSDSIRGKELKFSKHAASRLNTRNIELTDNQVERLQDGMHRAEEKGIRDSLVIMDKLAFIVNIPSSTVVTAMDQNETQKNIFTNIDGAVIV